MELIRCNAGIYRTSKKIDQGDFFVGRKKKKTTFSNLYKKYLAIRSHNNQELPQPRSHSFSITIGTKCHGILANLGLLPEIFQSLQNIT